MKNLAKQSLESHLT